MVIRGIKWVGICTADWNQTISFYRDILGLTLRSDGTRPTEGGEARWAEMATSNGDFIEVFDENPRSIAATCNREDASGLSRFSWRREKGRSQIRRCHIRRHPSAAPVTRLSYFHGCHSDDDDRR